MKRLVAFLRDRQASSSAEFAMVLPLLLIFLLGIIDVGRLLWTVNRIEKATQMGARFAIVTDPVPSGLRSLTAVGLTDSTGHVLTNGDLLNNYVMAKATYSGTAGTTAPTCTGNCTALGSATTTSFDAIYNRVKAFLPELARTSLDVSYSNSGLGYAGDPGGQDFYPIITVSVRDVTFKPISLALFNSSFTLAPISAALTMEDGQGSQSN
ncbi:TadE/TadG family type IV pilus assembly protein [Novosphingobium sp. Chol11]|jgi:Flp pilus assembly protein TadG|uniref:TadE/TadG family type IV pilus assembly protein n=1 Tax=Novosphingobium sp. Chol11 TaxID=1385763 RepID=UPI000BE288BF|nr:TadE/TadG family type IV pilus assembly protein [Novosphingobium sp. Chol11]